MKRDGHLDRADRRWAALAAGAAVVLSATMVAGQAPPMRTVVYASQIEAPGRSVPADFAPPPTTLEVREAMAVASRTLATASATGDDAVPDVPWNRWGLARERIDPSSIRFDDARDAWVADLDRGRVAVLTLDNAVQRELAATSARYAEPGEAVVAIEPDTGRVLGLVSDSSHAAVGADLALRAYAWSASTFKVITGAAVIATGAATPESSMCYHGGGSSISLDHLTDSPDDTICVDVTEAMATSANVVFARLADRHLTPSSLQSWAERFGYNARIPFELPLERSTAEIPDDRLEFARAAAGFRHTRMTAVHGALIEAALLNGGEMMVPTIVDRIEDASGMVEYRHAPVVWRRVLDADDARALRRSQATTVTTGTARNYFGRRDGFPRDIDAFGKTGTLSNRGIDGSTPDPLFTFTWFVGGAVRADREVAVAALAVNTDLWWVKGGYLASEAVLAVLAR